MIKNLTDIISIATLQFHIRLENFISNFNGCVLNKISFLDNTKFNQ